jgi:hypothetical protein
MSKERAEAVRDSLQEIIRRHNNPRNVQEQIDSIENVLIHVSEGLDNEIIPHINIIELLERTLITIQEITDGLIVDLNSTDDNNLNTMISMVSSDSLVMIGRESQNHSGTSTPDSGFFGTS